MKPMGSVQDQDVRVRALPHPAIQSYSLCLTRITHGLIYYEAKLPAILGRPRHSVLTVSGNTPPCLIPAGAQAWQPLWPLMTKNP